jgi:hypothetical protein
VSESAASRRLWLKLIGSTEGRLGGRMMTPQNQVSLANLPTGRFTCCLVLLLVCSFLAFPAFAQSQVETAARAKVPRVSSPAWGASNENTGSTPPKVTFEDGQLSISANDSSLADVLYALRASTGADIDIPPGAAAERVTAQLGPGPARKVLADLLAWSSFDYIIQGSDSDPLSIQSVTLMIRIKGATTSAPTTAPTVPSRIPMSGARPAAEPAAAPAEAPVPSPVSIEPDTTPPAASNAAPDSSGASPSAAVKPPDTSSPGSSTGKSPADMIQELQQMYQQRRALQEQQNRGSVAPVPGSSQ